VNESHHGSDQKVTFGTEPLHLAFVGYPLVTEDLKNLPDLLEHVPSQASALLALPKTFIDVHTVH
jgi:hypothetical protein